MTAASGVYQRRRTVTPGLLAAVAASLGIHVAALFGLPSIGHADFADTPLQAPFDVRLAAAPAGAAPPSSTADGRLHPAAPPSSAADGRLHPAAPRLHAGKRSAPAAHRQAFPAHGFGAAPADRTGPHPPASGGVRAEPAGAAVAPAIPVQAETGAPTDPNAPTPAASRSAAAASGAEPRAVAGDETSAAEASAVEASAAEARAAAPVAAAAAQQPASGAPVADVPTSGSPDSPAAATLHYPFKEVRLEFDLLYGAQPLRLGTVTHVLRIEDGHYAIEQVGEGRGLIGGLYERVIGGRLIQRSSGTVGPGGFVPDEFFAQRGRPDRRESAAFHWSDQSVVLLSKGGERTLHLEPGTQDLVSMLHQLFFMQPLPRSGKLVVATGRKVGDYAFEVVGDESVDTPAGTLRALHVRRIDADGDVVELWLDAGGDMLPVRIYTSYRDGLVLDFVLRRVSRVAAD